MDTAVFICFVVLTTMVFLACRWGGPKRKIIDLMNLGGKWADSIGWSKKYVQIEGFSHCSMVGCMFFDWENNQNEPYVPLYYITKMEWHRHIGYMYLADVIHIANIPNEFDGSRLWYKGPCKQALNELNKELSLASFFDFKRKRELKFKINQLSYLI